MREEPQYGITVDRPGGITPACAGRTAQRAHLMSYIRDHPRVCGKNSSEYIGCPAATGSPPRVREEHTFARIDTGRCGITPACAGRTWRAALRTPCPRDHPRVCGKNGCVCRGRCNLRGSPPRVREELLFSFAAFAVFGITPACAGRTVKKSPFYAFSFSSLFMNPFTFVTSSLKISTFVLLCCSVLSPIP